ncbi:uncharacterized protein PAC_04127 [Phialocephala subalpina]|uniref:Uncharacterized protein n=1 Tax=Phialocephala subalpina TaxID=576137 RepID=A0A1L7WN97_9HELO|nr:uncharacterized protein PAC_04127 [Phialocephala subalpina]
MAPSKDVSLQALTSSMKSYQLPSSPKSPTTPPSNTPRIVIGITRSGISCTFVDQFIRPCQFAHKMDELNPMQDFSVHQYHQAWERAVNLVWGDAANPDVRVDTEEFNLRYPGLVADLDGYRHQMEIETQAVTKRVGLSIVRGKEGDY